MDHLLSLSQAARMVGVSRKILQDHIQMGDLSVFEGSIRQSELMKLYPELNTDKSGMIEKMQRIKENAIDKYVNDTIPDPEHLMSEVQRLRAQLESAEAKIGDYEQLVTEMKDRMIDFQSSCDKKQSLMFNALMGWFYHQCKLREGK